MKKFIPFLLLWSSFAFGQQLPMNGGGYIANPGSGGSSSLPNPISGVTIVGSTINSVIPITQFGATGSQQTANGTAIANTSSITAVSGGDFVVGNFVRIPNAGAAPTISTPAAPTLTCTNTGLSCSSYTKVGAISSSVLTTTLTLTTPVTVAPGQVITIAGAGAAGADLVTTVVAPATFSTIVLVASPALTTVSGATITFGTLVYGYEIAAVQGLPNGAMTPASAAQTVTQTAQTPAGTGVTNQVYTTLTAYSVTGGTYYVIYKSVSGGPYNFYSITTQTTFNDTGNAAQSKFTCTDLDLPCTAPAATVPNDVFAKISAINGSTYTLVANPNPVKYTVQDGLPATTYPSQPTVSGSITLVHDDTPAFQAIRDRLLALAIPGHTTIEIPAGDYNVSAGDKYGNQSVFNFIGLDYVTIRGVGSSSRIHQQGLRTSGNENFVTGVCGANTNPTGINQQNRCRGGAGLTAYNLLDPSPYGQNYATLVSVADAANFTIGEYVVVYNNSAVYPGDTYQENNVVASVDTVSGRIGLQRPLNKYYSATLVSPWSNCSVCGGTPKIVPLPFGLAETNIILEDFWFEGDVKFVNMGNFDNLITRNLYIHSIVNDETGSGSRRLSTQNTIIDESEADAVGNLITGATGDNDVIASDNTYTQLGAGTQQSCQEDAANVQIINNRLAFLGSYPGTNAQYLFRVTNCANVQINNNQITVGKTNLVGIFSPVTTTAFDFAQIHHNQVHIDSVGNTGSVISLLGGAGTTDPNISISNNGWTIENNLSATSAGIPQYSDSPFFGQLGVGALPASLATFGSCDAAHEGITATQNDATTCQPGLLANAGSAQICPIWCDGAHWVDQFSITPKGTIFLTGTIASVTAPTAIGCTDVTATATGSVTAMSVLCTPQTNPTGTNGVVTWSGYISTNGTVDCRVCNAAAEISPPAVTYNYAIFR